MSFTSRCKPSCTCGKGAFSLLPCAPFPFGGGLSRRLINHTLTLPILPYDEKETQSVSRKRWIRRSTVKPIRQIHFLLDTFLPFKFPQISQLEAACRDNGSGPRSNPGWCVARGRLPPCWLTSLLQAEITTPRQSSKSQRGGSAL